MKSINLSVNVMNRAKNNLKNKSFTIRMNLKKYLIPQFLSVISQNTLKVFKIMKH